MQISGANMVTGQAACEKTERGALTLLASAKLSLHLTRVSAGQSNAKCRNRAERWLGGRSWHKKLLRALASVPKKQKQYLFLNSYSSKSVSFVILSNKIEVLICVCHRLCYAGWLEAGACYLQLSAGLTLKNQNIEHKHVQCSWREYTLRNHSNSLVLTHILRCWYAMWPQANPSTKLTPGPLGSDEKLEPAWPKQRVSALEPSNRITWPWSQLHKEGPYARLTSLQWSVIQICSYKDRDTAPDTPRPESLLFGTLSRGVKGRGRARGDTSLGEHLCLVMSCAVKGI